MFQKRVRGVLLALVCVALFTTATAHARRTQTCTVNPLAMVLGEWNITCEKRLSESMSYWSKALWSQLAVGSDTFSIGGGRLGLNFYPEREAPNGFYAGPSLALFYLSASGYDPYGYYYVEGGPAIGVGADTGYQWIAGNGLVLKCGVSAVILSASLSGTSVWDLNYSYTMTMMVPGISLEIGYGW